MRSERTETTKLEDESRDGLFRRVLDGIRKRVTRHQYETWFQRTSVTRLSGHELVIGVPNRFFQEWLAKNFRSHVAQAAQEIVGRRLDVSFEVREGDAVKDATVADRAAADVKSAGTVAETAPALVTPPAPPAPPAPKPPPASPAAIPLPAEPPLNLQPHYTFENFIIGPSNQMAHAGAKAVADNPGGPYNPLFLYGSVGLGKTHLLQAICHEVLRRNPTVRIVYLSCEDFTNQYVSAVQRTATEAFRSRFRNVDVLLIDDIHFLANKERTQEEFFHTFNALFQARRQIILSSDAPPSDIPTLEERLTSRFKWGLVAKLDQPEMETRMAIIRRKAELSSLVLPNDVVEYIASNVRNNIREIEGALSSVRSRASIDGVPVDLPLAKAALESALRHEPTSVSLDRITQIVASAFGAKVSDLRSKKRTKSVSLPRQVIMFLSREETTLSLEEIGDHFGGRDHTTVLYAANKVAERVATDEGFKAQIDRLKDRLHAR